MLAALCGAGAAWLHAAPALAHAICGSRVFPVTLTLDDPGVADELTIPQITTTRAAADGGPGPSHDTNIAFEYDKRLTEDFGLGFNDDYTVNQQNNAKTQTGWDDLSVTAKWAKCLVPDADFQLGFGVVREFGPHRHITYRRGSIRQHRADDLYRQGAGRNPGAHAAAAAIHG